MQRLKPDFVSRDNGTTEVAPSPFHASGFLDLYEELDHHRANTHCSLTKKFASEQSVMAMALATR